jgi:hypothetical protein
MGGIGIGAGGQANVFAPVLALTAMRRIQFPLLLLLSLAASAAFAHGVAQGDATYIQSVKGVQFFPYLYLGAKHMFTGYDHLLFLAGVIFFLYRLREVALYVSMFAVGHSLTLLLGVLGGIRADAYLVDTLIGFSVVYKAFDNLGGFDALGVRIDNRAAVFAFGLAHGFGLSTKLQDFHLSSEGLVANILAFNVGVELGQLAALTLILLAFQYWRRSPGFLRGAFVSNALIMTCGFLLMGYQLTGYFLS